MKELTLIAIMIFIKSIATAQQLAITNPGSPDRVGERMLTFNCPLDGNAKKDIEVWVYYSTNKGDLANENCSRGRASCIKNTSDPSKILCRFYFPHRDHMRPNKIHDVEKNGQEPPAEDKMRDAVEVATAYENMPELQRDREKQLNGFIYQSYKSINNTDANAKSINNPSKVYYKIVRKKQAIRMESQVFEFVMPRVFVIGYMGDSYSSGEGAPYSGNDKWDDDFCHRSEKSGGMRGINKLISRSRELVVRVINTTCSGAKIGNLISNRQEKGNASRKPQLEQIEDWCKANNRENVDIMLMGIGGNSIGFVPMATAALTPPLPGTDKNWFDFDKESGKTIDLFRELPGKYDTLNYFIENQDYSVGKVLIMNYPNMLYGPNRELCDNNLLENITSACRGQIVSNQLFGHINFFKGVLTDLNEEIRKASERHGWEVIRVSAINSHGLCNCDEPYFNNLWTSMDKQGNWDISGAIHPNADGYQELYRDNVYAALNKAVPDVQKEEYKARMKEAIKEAKAAAKEKMDKQVAKTIARKKLQEKYKAELATKAESQLDSIKIEIPKSAKPVAVKLKNNDDPRPKSNNDDKN